MMVCALSYSLFCLDTQAIFFSRYDLETASDLRYYALPDLHKKLAALEAKEDEEADARGGDKADTVTSEAIAEIVARWTGIPITRLISTEKEKLVNMERILSKNVSGSLSYGDPDNCLSMHVGQPEAVKAVANAIQLSRSGL